MNSEENIKELPPWNLDQGIMTCLVSLEDWVSHCLRTPRAMNTQVPYTQCCSI